MGIYKKIINIVNSNVYGTNLLLIPGMIISLLIVMDINIWSKNKDYSDNEIDKTKILSYKIIWYSLAFIFFITIFFSTIYHFSMFGNNNILRKLGSIDYKYTAPFLGLILFFMNIMYIIYIFYDCKNEEYYEIKFKYKTIYLISLLCTLVGSSVFILKKYFGYRGYSSFRSNTFIHKIKYIASHTFFHYTGYTGISILMILYFLENNNIYNFYFKNDCNIKI